MGKVLQTEMKKSKYAGIIKSASALLAVIIIVVTILLVQQKRRIDEQHEAVLKENIVVNEAFVKRLDDFFKYADSELEAKNKMAELREKDYSRYLLDEYDMVHLSMWDVSDLSAELYETYFSWKPEYAEYIYSTPMELKDYLLNIFASENDLKRLYINIDPYILEKNYYEALRYDADAKTFEEYIHSELFPILDAHPDIRFEMFLPARPVSYWAELPLSSYSEIMDKWYTFLMYLHWCPNAVVRFMGAEEWLVANDFNYISPDKLKEDVQQRVYNYLYAYEKFDVNAPELKQKREIIDKYIRRELNGEYSICDLSDRKIVFMGDSLFDFVKMDSAAVPGVVQDMTDADCYNLSIGGTHVSAVDLYGFARVANALSMKSTLDFDSRYKREAEKFLANYSDDDKLWFVLLYSMNDYFSSVPLTESELSELLEEDPESPYGKDASFTASLKYGLESLKQFYPNAKIIVLSPYRPDTNDEGRIPYQEGGHSLPEYIEILEEISKAEGVEFYSLYDNGPFNASNYDTYLECGVHTNESGAFVLGTAVSKILGEMISE